MRNVALDLGARTLSYCEVHQGRVIDRATVRSLSALLGRLGPDQPPARVAFEACREGWHVHDTLAEWGNEPLMLDTTRIKQLGVGQHGRKTNRLDTEAMAMALDEGRIALAHVLSPPRRALRFHLSVRRALVESRAQYVTTVRGLVRAQGQLLASCAAEDFVALVRRTKLEEATRALVAPLERLLGELNEQIALVDTKLEQLCVQEPVIAQLMTAPGVGLVVAAAVVTTLDSAGRFAHAHQVESYLGLVPCEDSTGDARQRRLGAISKQGNGYTRALLVQAAWCILRLRDPNDPLKQWGEAVAQRRGKHVAAVAVARRLAGVLWSMWRRGTVYDSAYVGAHSARGLAVAAQTTAHRAAALQRAAKKIRRRTSTSPKEGNAKEGRRT